MTINCFTFQVSLSPSHTAGLNIMSTAIKLDSSIVEQQIQSIVFRTPRCKNWAKGFDASTVRSLAEQLNPQRVENINAALAKYHNTSWQDAGVKSALDYFFCTDVPLLIDGHYLSIDITLKRRGGDLRYKLLKSQAFAPLVQPLLGQQVRPVIWSITEAPTPAAIASGIKQSKTSDIVLL
jgi:hypothetical protein